MGIGVLQGHDNKISRPSASSIISRTQLKFKNNSFLRLQTSILCEEKKGMHILTVPVYKLGLTSLVAQFVSIFRMIFVEGSLKM